MLKKLMLGTAAAALAWPALAEDLVIVSWGGAYSAFQPNAYHDLFMEMNREVNIINDESSAEAVAKLRALSEAGNTTWDSSTSSRRTPSACATRVSRWISTRTSGSTPRRDCTPPSEDFGDVDHLRLLNSPRSSTLPTPNNRNQLRGMGAGRYRSTSAPLFDLETLPR
jgi:hypothetical protein